jgi:hypothetical protein
VLGDRPVKYLRCTHCGLITADSPDWLCEAYSQAITALDVGLLERCIDLSHIAWSVIHAQRVPSGVFLDWAGGYGVLTRLMRDRGLEFYHHDPLCKNIFAQGLEASLERRYDLITAIEVLEHLVDPVATLAAVAESTDLLLVSTLTQPTPPPRPGEWWYYTPETGQHVAFYTPDALRELADRLGMGVLTLNEYVHLFHRVPVATATKILLRWPRLARALGALTALGSRRSSLQSRDLITATNRVPKTEAAYGNASADSPGDPADA